MASTAAFPKWTAAPQAPDARAARSSFHVGAALLLAASMVVGFYFDLPKYVLHPKVHFPLLLAIHSAVFVSWMLLYVAQTLLVRIGQVKWHRVLGWLGLVLAVIMPPLGIVTAIVMRRFDLMHFPSHDVAGDLAFMATPLADIVAFTPCAWLGIALRKRQDCHSRLMYLSMASLAETGFGRMPIPGASKWFFASNLAFYAAGMINDLLRLGRIHPVYLTAVPSMVAVEGFAMYLWLWRPVWWIAVCHGLTGIT